MSRDFEGSLYKMTSEEKRPLKLEHEGWRRDAEEVPLEKRKEDPIMEEFKFCPECEEKVLKLVDYVRNLENAQTVAKQALETLLAAQQKLTKENEMLMQEAAKQKDRAEKTSQRDLKEKMALIDKQHNRFVGRGR